MRNGSFFRNLTASVGLLFFVLFLWPHQASSAGQEPNPSNNAVLQSIMKSGAKLYYMGSQEGLDGWLIVKDGQVQMAYSINDGQHALIGALFGPSGENITTTQVQALLSTNKELNKMILASASGKANGADAGATNAMAAGSQAVSTAAAAVSQAVETPALLPPGERLMHDLQGAAWVSVGKNTAPLLMMIMDPNCPHCQATWRALRGEVFKNNLQIHMVPVSAPNTDSERAAAQMLHIADPLNAWDKYVAGDKNQLAGTPDAILVAAVRANAALIDSWHINVTPYLVYRAKDGQIKIVQGEPDQASAILNDIAP